MALPPRERPYAPPTRGGGGTAPHKLVHKCTFAPVRACAAALAVLRNAHYSALLSPPRVSPCSSCVAGLTCRCAPPAADCRRWASVCLAVYFLRSNEATRALAPVPVAPPDEDGFGAPTTMYQAADEPPVDPSDGFSRNFDGTGVGTSSWISGAPPQPKMPAKHFDAQDDL
jgi:hypothetical protein